MATGKREAIYREIDKERSRQDIKWGDQSKHPDALWMTILTEEIGEVAKEVLDGGRNSLIVELVQSAAVIVQWLEVLYDRDSRNQKA